MSRLTNILSLLALAVSLVVFHLTRETARMARSSVAESAAQHEQARAFYLAATEHFVRADALWTLTRQGCAEETHP